MKKENVVVGQKLVVVGRDENRFDPHDLEIGSIVTVKRIAPAIKADEVPPLVRFLLALEGEHDVQDLPERVNAITENGDFANFYFDEVEPYTENKLYGEGSRIKMTDDDYAEGFSKGDIFTVERDVFGDLGFEDNDGDFRYLETEIEDFIVL